ncbi:MAG: WD40/YVTN/BNR-like repeat-containing protein [Anaerolineales bacterium]
MKKHTRPEQVVIFCFAMAALLLAACGVVPAAPTPIIPPVPTATPQPPPTAPPTPTTTAPPPEPPNDLDGLSDPERSPDPERSSTPPPPVENPIQRLSSGQDVIITSLRMFDETTGWAIGGIDGPGDHVLQTSDGGQTWRDVTPPEPAPTGDEPQKAANGYFLDQNTAWVSYYYIERYSADRGPIVWRTQDGGQTWQPGEPLDTDSFFLPLILPEPIQFTDPLHGWLMENLHDAGMGKNYVMLYRTVDSGATWERIVEPMSGDLQSAGKTAMVFADAQTGVVTFDQGAYLSPFFTLTSDGGVTWEMLFLPPPETAPNLFDEAFCETNSPSFLSPSNLSIGVVCKTYDDEGEVRLDHFLYRTGDGGESWRTYPFPGGRLRFTSPDVVWALGGEIYRSEDGGQTWALVKTVHWDGQFSFVSETVGWAVARSGDEIALVRTTNGGERWEVVEPAIGP